MDRDKLPARIPEWVPERVPERAPGVDADRVTVLPPLHGRSAPAGERGARLSFEQRATRASRFPLEQALARIPEPPRLGRFLDVEV